MAELPSKSIAKPSAESFQDRHSLPPRAVHFSKLPLLANCSLIHKLRRMKYIFVTGGVVSSLGKGLAAASLGTLLEHRGLKVTLQKFDPYLNVDPGTMSPFQHGEVYVLNDGAETDLDLGHY